MTFSVEIVTTGGVRALSDVDVHKNNNLSGVEIYNVGEGKRVGTDDGDQ
uniref:Uncharacterized protein n=1 Tax=Meloidogyne enterolobii TaxID=390850 RepID=A0A6V7W5G7_MELEN|nr:unnamed protein product [Meloidogyne enterolobii]